MLPRYYLKGGERPIVPMGAGWIRSGKGSGDPRAW